VSRQIRQVDITGLDQLAVLAAAVDARAAVALGPGERHRSWAHGSGPLLWVGWRRRSATEVIVVALADVLKALRRTLSGLFEDLVSDHLREQSPNRPSQP
jgi:hypothetical protein